ncbi:MAG: Lrp/AsnC family transcriptional regulator [Victivallaceae bacterium]|nr:Lrp/AsnC family transcriptional regulator [Victivallaceae bacterium]
MMDKTDRKIISILSCDGRANNNHIARELNMSEGTVRNHIKKLSEDGILRVAGGVNPDKIPDKHFFILGVKVAASKDLTNVAEIIAEFDEVLSVCITTGRYDLMVEAWLPVKNGLIDFISRRLASVDGIVSSESFLAMKSLKKWIVTGE